MSRATRWGLTARNGWRATWIALGVAGAACHYYDIPTKPDYGFVRVEVNASGGDLDTDGYDIILDNLQILTLKDATLQSIYVRAGEHTVSIAKVAANCAVTGPTTRTVSVDQNQSVTVTFDVVCLATGLAVTARTTGPDSPDSLRIAVDNAPVVLVAANGVRTIGRLSPGSHRLTVTPPVNCTVAGGNAYTVAVAAAKITDVALEVSCMSAVRLPKIAYAVDAFINRVYVRSIELVNVDGTGAVSLQVGDAPAWSPDGKRLAFSDASCPSGFYDYYYDYYCSGGIIVADPELGNATRLAGGRYGAHPSWSPTGSAIVFHDIASDYDLMLNVLATLTGARVTLTIAGPNAASQPAWSPDGTRIAFTCRWLVNTDICIANADGTGVVHLTDDAQPDKEPAWSPDGKKLAFARYPVGRTDDESAQVAVMDLATRQITLLGAGADPAWSPDGAKLVVAGIDGLFVMNADGSGSTRLTTGLHHAPAWRP